MKGVAIIEAKFILRKTTAVPQFTFGYMTTIYGLPRDLKGTYLLVIGLHPHMYYDNRNHYVFGSNKEFKEFNAYIMNKYSLPD